MFFVSKTYVFYFSFHKTNFLNPFFFPQGEFSTNTYNTWRNEKNILSLHFNLKTA